MTAEEMDSMRYPAWMLDASGKVKPLEERIAEMRAYLYSHPTPPADPNRDANNNGIYKCIPTWQRSKRGQLFCNNGQYFVIITLKAGAWQFTMKKLTTKITEYPVEAFATEVDATIAATTEIERRSHGLDMQDAPPSAKL